MTDESPILLFGQTRIVALDGIAYTIAALTHGQHAAVQVALAAHRLPSAEFYNDTIRRLAEAAGDVESAEAVQAEHEAADALNLHQAAAPPALDADGLRAWEADHAAELARLRKAALAAGRRARVARERYGARPEVAGLAAQIASVEALSAQHLVASGLRAVDGVAWAGGPERVGALPSGHVAILAAEITRMMSPTRDAAKN